MYKAPRQDVASQNVANISDPAVVYGHRVVQTKDVKWLCLDKIYQKLNRPNFYDIGGTYMQDVADYWFTYKTEQIGSISLLHLFICNHGLSSFNVAVSFTSSLKIDRRSKIAYLPQYLKNYQFTTLPELTHSYVTTYSFSELDVTNLENKMLYIAVSFSPNSDNIGLNVIEEIKLKHDCDALLHDPLGSDFTIESADGAKFKVHKAILAANSEVFKAMLKEETAESQKGYVMLMDVNEDDLKFMLEYIYTGTIKDGENANFISLFMIADKYDLKGLWELSQYALADQLNLDNAVEILMVSDLHECDYLKTEAFKFIKLNADILQSNTFSEINNVELVRQLCVYLAS